MRTEANGNVTVYRGTLVAHTQNTDLVKHQTIARLQTEQISALSSTWSKFRVLHILKLSSEFVRNGIAGDQAGWIGRENRICQREELVSRYRAPVSMQGICQISSSIDKSFPLRPKGHSIPKWGNNMLAVDIASHAANMRATTEELLGENMIMRGMYFGILFTNEVAV